MRCVWGQWMVVVLSMALESDQLMWILYLLLTHVRLNIGMLFHCTQFPSLQNEDNNCICIICVIKLSPGGHCHQFSANKSCQFEVWWGCERLFSKYSSVVKQLGCAMRQGSSVYVTQVWQPRLHGSLQGYSSSSGITLWLGKHSLRWKVKVRSIEAQVKLAYIAMCSCPWLVHFYANKNSRSSVWSK